MRRTLEVVGFKDVPLPAPLQAIFFDWNITRTSFYAIYTMRLDYIGDEHLTALDKEFKSGHIAHWSCSDGQSAESYNR